MTILILILALVFAILAIIFAQQNPMIVTVSFYGYSVDGSFALIILVAVIIGIIIGALVMTPGAVKRRLELRSHRKKLGGLEKTLEEQKDKIAKAEHIISIYDPPSNKDSEH